MCATPATGGRHRGHGEDKHGGDCPKHRRDHARRPGLRVAEMTGAALSVESFTDGVLRASSQAA
jgi:hypothetical protein